MSQQLELFNRFIQLSINEALPIYWELEGKFMSGRSHKYDLKRIAEYLGDKLIHLLTPYDITAYREYRKIESREMGKEIKESSLNREHGRLTRIINALKEWKHQKIVGPYDFSELQLPSENPGELVKKPSERKYRRNLIVTPEMFSRFCDYAHPRIKRICVMAVLTLLRKKDIRLLEDQNLNRALDYLSGIQSKTGIPYNIPVTLTVKIIFNQAKEEEHGYICNFTNFRRYFERARKESGIYFQFRDLRKSGATQLLLEGIDIRTIQKLLGHADISTTEVYLEPPTTISKEATKKLEEKFVTFSYDLVHDFCEN